jgi:hypothetical protein
MASAKATGMTAVALSRVDDSLMGAMRGLNDNCATLVGVHIKNQVDLAVNMTIARNATIAGGGKAPRQTLRPATDGGAKSTGGLILG